jgi:hypothetical protein
MFMQVVLIPKSKETNPNEDTKKDLRNEGLPFLLNQQLLVDKGS